MLSKLLRSAGFAIAIITLSWSGDHSSQSRAMTGLNGCPTTARIVIKNFMYNGGTAVTIRAGDSVVWINNDDMPHTATSSDPAQSFDTGLLQPGESSEPILFLKESGTGGFAYTCNVHDGMKGSLVVVPAPAKADDCNHHETPSVHSMVVTGLDSKSIFLHHIALFHDSNHYYHATFEAKVHDAAAQAAYEEFRKTAGDGLCVLDPELFLLPDLQSGKRTSFKATFFSGKWESEIPGLKDAQVDIVRTIQFRRYESNAVYPDRLTYQLYGNSKEVFLAHQVTEAPNFQQVIKLREIPSFLTPEIIKSNPLLVIPTKELTASGSRLIKTAVLTNGSHLVLSPPTGSLSPQEPLRESEVLEVRFEGAPEIRQLTVGKLIYFDTRILNK